MDGTLIFQWAECWLRLVGMAGGTAASVSLAQIHASLVLCFNVPFPINHERFEKSDLLFFYFHFLNLMADNIKRGP